MTLQNQFLQKDVSFAQNPENLMLAKLGDDKKEIRKLAVDNIRSLRRENQKPRFTKEGYVVQSDDDDDEQNKPGPARWRSG